MSHRFASREDPLPRIDVVLKPDNVLDPAAPGAVYRNAGIPTYGVAGVFMMESEAFRHGLNERIRVDAFYDALTYWSVLIRSLAGG